MQIFLSSEPGSAALASPGCPPFNSTIQTRRFPPHPSPSPRASCHWTVRVCCPPPLIRRPESQPSHFVAAGPPQASPTRRATAIGARAEGAVRTRWSALGDRARPRSPLAATSAGGAGPGSGHLPSLLLGAIGRCRALAPGGKSSGGKAWGCSRASPGSSCPVAWRGARDVLMPPALPAPAGNFAPRSPPSA
jgi:hypothetical protein